MHLRLLALKSVAWQGTTHSCCCVIGFTTPSYGVRTIITAFYWRFKCGATMFNLFYENFNLFRPIRFFRLVPVLELKFNFQGSTQVELLTAGKGGFMISFSVFISWGKIKVRVLKGRRVNIWPKVIIFPLLRQNCATFFPVFFTPALVKIFM